MQHQLTIEQRRKHELRLLIKINEIKYQKVGLDSVIWEYLRRNEAIVLHKKTGATKYYKWTLSFDRGFKTLLAQYKKERSLL